MNKSYHIWTTQKIIIDLFCGGGSVYTNVVDKYQKILINDKIEELILIHKNLIQNPDTFIQQTKSVCVDKNSAEQYAKLRSDFNSNKTPDKLWALMLSCTNNMMRLNKKFEFNQTFGKRSWNDNTQVKVEQFVNHITHFKDKIYFSSKDFFEVIPKKPSMVYLDPPYTNTEAGYNCYWNQQLEDKLYDYVLELDKNGHSFMLSGVQGKHKEKKESLIIQKLLDKGFNHKILDFDYEKVARNKNTKESQEIIIFNY